MDGGNSGSLYRGDQRKSYQCGPDFPSGHKKVGQLVTLAPEGGGVEEKGMQIVIRSIILKTGRFLTPCGNHGSLRRLGLEVVCR